MLYDNPKNGCMQFFSDIKESYISVTWYNGKLYSSSTGGNQCSSL